MKTLKATIKVVLPRKVSSNAMYSGLHWAERKRIADEFHREVWVAVAGRKPKGLKFPLAMSYKFYLPGKPLDVSNLALMVKCLEDGLVREKVLPDDGPEYVRSITLSLGKLTEKQRAKDGMPRGSPYAEVRFEEV